MTTIQPLARETVGYQNKKMIHLSSTLETNNNKLTLHASLNIYVKNKGFYAANTSSRCACNMKLMYVF